ncbi:MAG: PilZ domain-containing protein [Nitrospirae bacterium]|nr:PilZ domain-containing protein [Nitrospirota bacterium]
METTHLCLLMCKNYKREADAVIKSGTFPDVKVIAYPAVCYSGKDLTSVSGFMPSARSRCGSAVFIGGLCKEKFKTPAGPLRLRVLEPGSCFYMVANREIIDRYLRERAYIITPGFLGQWRQFVREMKLDRKSARKLFGLMSSKIVLLDTGVDRDTSKRLQEFAAFLNLPAETVPVGIDHFRMFLKEIILEWRLEKDKPTERAPAEKRQKKVRARPKAVAVEVVPEIHGDFTLETGASGQVERREHKRFMIKRRCLVEMNDSEMVELMDISLGGMRLSIPRSLPPGGIHSLKIFPSIKSEIHLKGEVVWSSAKPDAFETGLRFVRINDDERHSVGRFMNLLTP